ncbi:MAG: DoxX-like family protein, partial [Deltaproteobacteria bacterium]
GEGETVGTQESPDGPRTSALKFWSDDRKSLICEGAGYWQYLPVENGVRFLTAYDYRVRFGRLGRVIDVLIFRPLITWATAWSFDRLRLWIECRIEPAESLRLALIHATARLGLAFVWLYQGIVPKLLWQHADELAMFADGGWTGDAARLALWALGSCEIAFGLSLLAARRTSRHFVATIVLATLATLAVAVASPRFLAAAFNPVSLNTLMAALAAVGLLAERNLPSARRCRFCRRVEGP